MMPLPRFDKKSIDVLRVVRERGIVRGAELQRLVSSLTATDLVNALRELNAADLTDSAGNTSDPEQISYAQIGFKPSARSMIDFILMNSSNLDTNVQLRGPGQ